MEMNTKFYFVKGLMGYDRKKIKKAWNIGDYQLIVLYSDGGIFTTRISVIIGLAWQSAIYLQRERHQKSLQVS